MTDNVIDPVCGMEVDPAEADSKNVFREHTYYFCAPGCKVQFEKDPENYITKQEE